MVSCNGSGGGAGRLECTVSLDYLLGKPQVLSFQRGISWIHSSAAVCAKGLSDGASRSELINPVQIRSHTSCSSQHWGGGGCQRGCMGTDSVLGSCTSLLS